MTIDPVASWAADSSNLPGLNVPLDDALLVWLAFYLALCAGIAAFKTWGGRDA